MDPYPYDYNHHHPSKAITYKSRLLHEDCVPFDLLNVGIFAIAISVFSTIANYVIEVIASTHNRILSRYKSISFKCAYKTHADR